MQILQEHLQINFCSGTTEAYTTDVLNIAGFTATQLSGFRYRIYFDDLVGGPGFEWGFCFDSATITSATPPSCPDPLMLTASNITDTTVDLAWTESGSATAWDIEVLTTGTPPTGVPTASGVTNPYTLTGLMENTEYDYYVRANCGVDGTSALIGPFMFTTACAPIAAPYTENFETFTTGVAAFVSENCWTGTGGAYYWESAPGTDAGSAGIGPDPSITTGNYFYTEASGGVSGNTTDLVSPLVDLTALTTPALTFNYHMFRGQIGTLDVFVNGTTNVWTLSGEQQASATTPWELAVVDLAAYTGQTISVTFRATSAGTFEGDIAIDNVSFTELPAWAGPFCFTTLETCPSPSALTATTITETTADLGWTENGAATVWNIELVDITAGGTATASGVANPYAATGLVGDNNYEFYVQADCGVDGTSAWAGPFAFATPYVVVPPTCTNGIFLDSGGASGDYTSGENITYTITPDTPGDAVSVIFTAFSTENNGAAACYDGLTIYNGPDATFATIDPPGGGTIWCWDRDDAPAVGTGDLQGQSISSTDPSGALTFVFTSDGSVTREGWEATVTCGTLSTVEVETSALFTYYPNPVNNTLTLNAQKEISNVAVFNMLGQQVIRTAPNAVSNVVDMSNLQSGVYFVQVTIGQTIETVRVIKD